MLLKFFARPEHLQPWPNSHSYGQPRRYIGWQWLPANEAKGVAARYEPKRDGDTVDTAVTSDADVEHIKRLCTKGAYWAADAATAAACGVALTKLEFSDAGFLPVKSTAPAKDKSPKE
jgi:hypothetical protein